MNSTGSTASATIRAALAGVAIFAVWFPWFLKALPLLLLALQKRYVIFSDVFALAPYLAIAVIGWQIAATMLDGRARAWMKNTLWSVAAAPVLFAGTVAILELCATLWFWVSVLRKSANVDANVEALPAVLIASVVVFAIVVRFSVFVAAIPDAIFVWLNRRRHDRSAFIVSDSLCAFLVLVLLIRLPIGPRGPEQKLPPPNRQHVKLKSTKLDKLHELVRTGGNVNGLVDGNAPLTIAVRYGELATAQLLVDRGAVDAGGKALLLAEQDDANLVRVALNAKAPIDATDANGKTPLMARYEWSIRLPTLNPAASRDCVRLTDESGCERPSGPPPLRD